MVFITSGYYNPHKEVSGSFMAGEYQKQVLSINLNELNILAI